MKTLTGAVTTFLLLLGGMSESKAAFITFDSLDGAGNPFLFDVVVGDYRFTSPHAHVLGNPDLFGGPVNGTTYIGSELSSVRMTRVDGGTFSLSGFDAAEVNISPNAASIRISTTSGVLGTYALDGINDGAGPTADFQTITFAPFTNLTSVTFVGVSSSGGFGTYAIDNIRVDELNAVPAPAGIVLLATALPFGGYFGWRRRKQAMAV